MSQVSVRVHYRKADGTVEPLANTGVMVVRSQTNNDNAVSQAQTNAEGVAVLAASQVVPGQLYWVQADTASGIRLQTMLGQEVPESVVVNEITTVAAIWAAAQFMAPTGYVTGPSLPMKIVAGMAANLADVSTGTVSPVLTAPPNGRQTTATRTLLSLANLLAGCIQDAKAREELLQLTGATSVTGALLQIAVAPALHCDSIFALSLRCRPYAGSLDAPPTAWTLAVKVNDSGCTTNAFGGPGNVAFDEQGYAWIANNVVQGTPNATAYSICLAPDGRPAGGAGGPAAVVTGGGLLGPGFGVCVWQGQVWYGNFGWGDETQYKEPAFGVSAFDAATGEPLSGGFQAPPPDSTGKVPSQRTQSVVMDSQGNLWCANYESAGVTVLLNDGARTPMFCSIGHASEKEPTFGAFGIACVDTADGGTAAWVTSSTPIGEIAYVTLSGGKLSLVDKMRLGEVLKGVAVDERGVVWTCSGTNSQVYAIEPGGHVRGFSGGGIDGPWGCCLDGDGNLWVANFGPLRPGPEFRGRLSQLAASGTSAAGQALSPSTGYTLPSDGEPVTLASGLPLYGQDAPPCYIPFMRSTGVEIDEAGNVWVCNNWKPDFVNDHLGVDGRPANPGGDGMVIFVGLAKPPQRGSSAT